MSELLMTEKAQNERNTSNLDTLPHPRSSSPRHRPERDKSQHDSYHLGGGHHHSESHQHRDVHQDFHNSALSQSHHSKAHPHDRAHHRTSLGLGPSPATIHHTEPHHDASHHQGRHHYHGGHQHHQHPGVTYQSSETSSSTRHHLPGVSQHHSVPGHHGGLHHKSPFYHQEDSYRSGDPYHHSEEYHHRGSQPREAHQFNRLHTHDTHPHRKHHRESIINQPSQESYHRGTSHFHRESYHGGHRPSEDHRGEHHHHRDHQHGEQHHTKPHHGEHHHPREHHPREHHHPELRHSSTYHDNHLRSDFYRDLHSTTSQLFVPHKPHSAVGSAIHQGLPHGSRIQSFTTVHSPDSQGSTKVHPQDTSTIDSESWSEDEQYQRQKRARGQRTHKKFAVNIIQLLREKLRTFLWGPWTIIRNLTQSWVFETFIFLIIFLNIIMLMAQTFAEVKIRGEWYFMAFDCIFLSIYIIEALLKITSLGLQYFQDAWNNLDFFVMVIAVLDFMLMQINSLFSFYNHSLFRILKVLKIMRALRAIRFVRRLRILTSFKEVMGTLVGSLLSIITIFILIFSCLLFFSMILMLFRTSDPWHFENLFITMFTLFTVLTLDDWSFIYMDNRAQGAWYIIPILMIYIFIQNIIFLNLLTAVLVDNFQMALLRDEEKVKQEMTAWIHEKLLDDSLTEINQTEPEEVKSEDTVQNMKKFETVTDKQWELQSKFLKLVAQLEHKRQKFSSGARVIDEVVDTTFVVNQRTSRKELG